MFARVEIRNLSEHEKIQRSPDEQCHYPENIEFGNSFTSPKELYQEDDGDGQKEPMERELCHRTRNKPGLKLMGDLPHFLENSRISADCGIGKTDVGESIHGNPSNLTKDLNDFVYHTLS